VDPRVEEKEQCGGDVVDPMTKEEWCGVDPMVMEAVREEATWT
jgi:hypothetical protein